ncbi:MAG: hypothetical protein AMXMBFR58_11120 [Phycisphaerae bacterium]
MSPRVTQLAVRAALAPALLLPACAYQRDESAVALVERGHFGAALERVQETATVKPEDRNYVLDRMKIVSMALAEGIPQAVEPVADRLYDRLRTQGLNDDNRFASAVLTEGAVRIYKGDPFEQALAFTEIAVMDGVMGDWGNMRAAAQQSLFLLRDFSQELQSGNAASIRKNGSGGRPAASRSPSQTQSQSQEDADEQVELVRAAAEAEREGKSGDALGMDYTAVASDFEIGYLLRAVASRRLGEREDMDEALRTVVQVAPRLEPVAGLIASGNYNTVFVVEYGVAPEKYGTGPDNAVAARMPVTKSADAPLVVGIAGQSSQWPIATDVNRIASSTRWANLEDVRVAKSSIGSLLVAGGLVTAAVSDDDNETQQLIGLAAAGLGALLKATSSADVRHNELFPQRSYLALADLQSPVNRVEFSIGASRLVLPDVPGGPGGELRLHYVRMPSTPEAWATGEELRYTNELTGDLDRECLPYILGGRDVQPPSLRALQGYQRSGYLLGFSVDDLRELYREEQIRIAGADGTWDQVGLHVLEGGSWLYTPAPASTGYKRLFYRDHEPYKPQSARVKELRRAILEERATRSGTATSSSSSAEQPHPAGVEMQRQSMDRGLVNEALRREFR